MTNDRDDAFRVLDLAERALELPPDERVSFLRREAAGDVRFFEETRTLLREAEAEAAADVGESGPRADGEPAAPSESPRLVTATATADLLARLEDAPRLDSDRFEVREMLGAGGMGKVLRVEDHFLKRPLAMKVPHSVAPRSPRTQPHASVDLGRFLEEAQVTSQLDHPGVVPVHDIGLDDEGRVCFLMRRVLGESAGTVFEKARAERDGWTLARALEVVLKVCDTMAYAHSKGVLHRDLKPDNVRVGGYGEVYVMDWGLAKLVRDDERDDVTVPDGRAVASTRTDDARANPGSSVVTMDGKVLGTVFYMSPEQALGGELDHRTDVYAIGAMLYELLAGKPPYHDPDRWPHDVLEVVRERPPQRVEQLAHGVAAELVAIVEKAMARDPAERYGSATELAADLRAFLDRRVVKAYRTGAIVELRMWIRRNKPLATSLAAAVAILAAGVLVSAILAHQKSALASAEATAKASFEEKVDEFNQLAVVVKLERAVASERDLHPAWPAEIPAMLDWIANECDPLLAERPNIARTVASLRRGFHLASLRRAQAIREDPARLVAATLTAEQRGLDADALNNLAWQRVDPNPQLRAVWAEEALGLALARRAVEKSAGSPSHCDYLDTLAWALVANGQDRAARDAAGRALAAAPAERAADFEHWLRAVEAAASETSEILAAAAERADAAGAGGDQPRATGESAAFLLRTLVGLLAELDHFEAEQKAAVLQRLAWARRIVELSRDHPNARTSWAEARARIRDSARYAGSTIELRDDQVLGLVPLGENPVTGYFEFYHLYSAWDGESDPGKIAVPEHRDDGSIAVTDGTGIVFVLLPGGACRLGSQASDPDEANYDSESESDETPHDVTLEPFFLARHELTQGQWKNMLSGMAELRASQYRAGEVYRDEEISLAHPVETVSWTDCDRMLTRHALVLPTEAQWEYACRAGTTTPWSVAKARLAEVANVADATAWESDTWWYCEPWRDGHVVHAPVGSYAANGFGLYDMHGNVFEWCRDPYSADAVPRPGDGLRPGPAGDRSYRGGGFGTAAFHARSSGRFSLDPRQAMIFIGVRPARLLER